MSPNERFKLALTGTPMENRLIDLWSIFDFIDRGLLDSQPEFKKFVVYIGNSHDFYSELHKITSSFILRRLKTDKRIISDSLTRTRFTLACLCPKSSNTVQ